jgi:hypothetical protein
VRAARRQAGRPRSRRGWTLCHANVPRRSESDHLYAGDVLRLFCINRSHSAFGAMTGTKTLALRDNRVRSSARPLERFSTKDAKPRSESPVRQKLKPL